MSISHRQSRHPIYLLLHSMKARCYNPQNDSYKYYGGRGIVIAEEWLNDPTAFIEWATNNGWAKGLQIDRKDVNGNYTPDNCRFVTQTINIRNTRTNIKLTYNGQTKCLSEWGEVFKIKYTTLHSRITVLMWPPEKAFNTPVRQCRC